MESKPNENGELAIADVSECRANSIGIAGFAECLCTGPNACAHALPFGYAFLCRHPRIAEIVENTKKERQGRVEAN